jgi:hypothetical protein
MSLTRPQMAPNAMRLSEWVMAAFDGLPVPVQQRMYIQILLFSFVRGVASALEPETDALRDSGLSPEEWMAAQATTIAQLISTEGMPHFRRLTAVDFDFDLDKLFEFGLGRLLDGIDLLVSRPPRRGQVSPREGRGTAATGAAAQGRGQREAAQRSGGSTGRKGAR